MTALWAIVCGVFGLAVGSFVNVVIWRVPRGESVAAPPSHCPGCSRVLTPAENIPVVSWLALRGRCRTCAAPISIRYPLVELITAGLWAAIGARFADDVWALPAFLVLSAALVALSAIDLDTMLLPNKIVYPTGLFVLIGLGVAAVAESDGAVIGRAVAGGAVYFAAYYVLWFVVGGRALGFGDVRLAAVLGLALGWLGWTHLWWGMFVPFLVGAVGGMLLVAAWLVVPMTLAAALGAVFAVDLVEGWTGGDVGDPAAARVTVGIGAGVFIGSVVFVTLSMLRLVARGRALPFGPSMAVGCLAVILLGRSAGL